MYSCSTWFLDTLLVQVLNLVLGRVVVNSLNFVGELVLHPVENLLLGWTVLNLVSDPVLHPVESLQLGGMELHLAKGILVHTAWLRGLL